MSISDEEKAAADGFRNWLQKNLKNNTVNKYMSMLFVGNDAVSVRNRIEAFITDDRNTSGGSPDLGKDEDLKSLEFVDRTTSRTMNAFGIKPLLDKKILTEIKDPADVRTLIDFLRGSGINYRRSPSDNGPVKTNATHLETSLRWYEKYLESDPWPYEPGELTSRKVIGKRFGEGRIQAGIVPLKKRDDILLFSSKKHLHAGVASLEGMREDGTFRYVGMGGQDHDEKLLGNYQNKHIIDSRDNTATLRVFLTEPSKATYVGAFALADVPYTFQVPDGSDTNKGRFIVFNLIPIGQADTSLFGEMSTDPAAGTTGPTGARTPDHGWPVYDRKWQEKNTEDSREYEPGQERRSLHRREMSLQNRFGRWLEDAGHDVHDVTFGHGDVHLTPDLFDATENMVMEAKVSTAREYVRTAIGQVLDYRHCMNTSDDYGDVTAGILLPGEPVPAMLELCRELSITVFMENGEGSFDVFPESSRAEFPRATE
ncbi:MULTISPECIES: hypothetical protein [Bifidobacterium]|uniref:Restriction endonuclease n=1 Tax=Bifidobacterium tibiigranuli TaxID=2172043 RepID=A0A5N6S9R0_9BIFI|nr:hypothetical protein [Bifidobacterium tibiigranuli]KAE8130250.1 hypothetical protein DDE84_01335 [Bifidobacterium tibiigranuli]KAE8130391.1 hypothetical protein DDF78_00320 [Bifidobacterium tibiigranuli]